MDIEKSFRYPFEDQQWTSKLGLGALISIVPILNFAWTGYLVGIIRNVMDNAVQPLPAWDNLEKKFMDGLIFLGAGIVYALPVLIALCLPVGVMTFSGILSGTNDLQDIGRRLGEAGGILFSCLLCLFVLYGLALSVIYPAILILFAREGTFACCFKLREAFEMISRNAAPFFTAWGLSLLAGLGVGVVVGIVNMVVGWIPCIGWIVSLVLSLGSGVYVTAVYAHLFGQFGQVVFGQRPLIPTNPSLQEPT